MILTVIHDSKQDLNLRLNMEGIPPKYYTVELFDHKRGIYRQHFTFQDYSEAKETFNELQRVYNLH